MTSTSKDMATYKKKDYVQESQSTDFDGLHNPGDRAPASGIYRCEACGREISHNAGVPLPPQNHHQHPSGAAIRWRLIVKAAT